MLRLAALIAVLSSCGSSKPPVPTAQRDDRRTDLCKKAGAFQQQECSPFHHMDPQLLADCSVVDSLFIAAIDHCMDLPQCEAFQSCATKVRLQGGTFDGPTRACADTSAESVPAGFAPDELSRSIGRNDKKFSDTVSTAALPIEVCGMPDQLAYLTRVTCNDGSHPFADRTAADHARAGNVGRAGRCQRVVDEYVVPCPEQTYRVFIDPYRCPVSH
jgi:hypothetical protein